MSGHGGGSLFHLRVSAFPDRTVDAGESVSGYKPLPRSPSGVAIIWVVFLGEGVNGEREISCHLSEVMFSQAEQGLPPGDSFYQLRLTSSYPAEGQATMKSTDFVGSVVATVSQFLNV